MKIMQGALFEKHSDPFEIKSDLKQGDAFFVRII